MKDFKKALISTAVVLMLVTLLCGWIVSVNPKNEDARLRESLAGEVDCLIIGASQAEFALYTRAIDEGLECSSYNLAYDAYSTQEKELLLREEFARNDIKTVIFELSYDTLKHGKVMSYTRANTFTVLRLSSFRDRMEYFWKYVNLENKLLTGSQWLLEGIRQRFSAASPLSESTIDLKGTRLMYTTDYTLPDSEVASAYNRDSFSTDSYNPETIEKTAELIAMCKENCDNVYVVVVPVSDNFIWSNDNLDQFEAFAQAFCEDAGVPFFDFNLMRSRYELFSDTDSFGTDYHHMSGSGAKVFSPEFAKIIRAYENGDDVTDFFYSSYEEAKRDSPYRKIYAETAQ